MMSPRTLPLSHFRGRRYRGSWCVCLILECYPLHTQVKLGEDVMCGTKIVIKPVMFLYITEHQLNLTVMGQVITKDPAMGQGAQHQMGGPIGGQGLMGGAPMPRLAITIPYSTIPNTLLFTTQHDHYMWAGPRDPCMWAILF